MQRKMAGGRRLQIGACITRRRRANILVEALEPRQLLSTNVLQWHNDAMGTGLNATETLLTPANVNSTTFGKLSNTTVNGAVYAQPLYVSGLNMGALGTHNVVFIVTEANDVYAYSVDNPAAPSQLWHDSSTTSGLTVLGTAIPKNSAGGPNEVNFSGGVVGITGTPVIDLSTNTLYFDSTARAAGTTTKYVHTIYALNILDGSSRAAITLEKHGDNVANGNAVEVSVPGDALDALGATAGVPGSGLVYFNPAQQLQRPGLTILGDNVYVAYGSYGDTDPYHGWVIGFDKSTLAITGVFCTTPNTIAGTSGDGNAGEGAIWQGGAALTTDGTRLYMVTANGDFETGMGTGAYSDSVVALTVDNTTTVNSPGLNGYGLKVADFFTPSNQALIGSTAVDLDLGSAGAIVLPTQNGPFPNELLLGSKAGTIYLLNRDNLGGYSETGPDSIIQAVALNGSSTGNVGHSMRFTPAYFNQTLYFLGSGDNLKAYSLADGLLSAGAIAAAPTSTLVPIAPNYGSTPSISASGTSNGIVWVTLYSASQQSLVAYDATTMAVLYSSNANAARDKMGGGPHFSEPTIADGMVFDAGNNFFTLYGLLPAVTTSPATPPQNVAVNTSTGGQLTVTWTGTSNTNEYGYDIFRSNNSSSGFTQAGSAGVDGTSFTDTAVTIGATYFYEVFARNSIGSSAASSIVSGVVSQMSSVTDRYRFDEGGTLTTTADSGTGALTGTLTGTVTQPAWVPGVVGNNALFFNGANGAASDIGSTITGATVTTSGNLNTTLGGSATMVVWVKTTQVGNDDPTLAPAIAGVYQTNAAGFKLSANVEDGGNDIRWGYIDGAGHIGIAVDGRNAVSSDASGAILPAGLFGVTSQTAINDGQWHNVAFTRNAANGLLQVYVDGVLQGSFYADPGTKTSTFNLIGAQIDKNSSGTTTGHTYFIGALDELTIYNQVLSPGQIAALGPVALAANPLSASSVQLTWTNVANSAASIEIDRAVGNAAFAPLITGLSGTVSSYTDSAGLSSGTAYSYQIRAVNSAGTSLLSNPASAIAAAPHVVAGYVFYKGSPFDVSTHPGDNADDNALAPDKTALFANQTASFANYTSYSNGLNGIMLDLTGNVAGLSPSDFQFATGGVGGVDNVWTPVLGPAPIIITRPMQGQNGAGSLGATRVEILFNNGQIQNAWLQITVLANANTGLAASSVFYFGNAIGETGTDPTSARVDAIDELVVRAAMTDSAAISNPADFNRDGRVDQADVLLARSSGTWFLNQLDLIQNPAGDAGAAATLSSAALGEPPTPSWPVATPEVPPIVETSSTPLAPLAPANPIQGPVELPGADMVWLTRMQTSEIVAQRSSFGQGFETVHQVRMTASIMPAHSSGRRARVTRPRTADLFIPNSADNRPGAIPTGLDISSPFRILPGSETGIDWRAWRA